MQLRAEHIGKLAAEQDSRFVLQFANFVNTEEFPLKCRPAPPVNKQTAPLCLLSVFWVCH